MTRRTTRPTLTPQQVEAERIRQSLLDAAADDLRELVELLATTTDRTNFGATEFAVRNIVHRIGAKAVETALGGGKGGYDGSSRTCPTCRESARFQRWRSERVVTALGRVRVSRAYDHGPLRQAGHGPPDVALGLTAVDLSRGASEAVALAGVLTGFAEAATKTLPKLAGLRVSESTVGRATERVGRDVSERLGRGETFGRKATWEWSKDADGKAVADVSADATGVGMQGENGAAADGRMAAVGMVWNAGKPGQVRYVCGLTGGLNALGEPLRKQGAQVGMDRAGRWVAISDGGAGLEGWLRGNLSRAEAVVLDF